MSWNQLFVCCTISLQNTKEFEEEIRHRNGIHFSVYAVIMWSRHLKDENWILTSKCVILSFAMVYHEESWWSLMRAIPSISNKYSVVLPYLCISYYSEIYIFTQECCMLTLHMLISEFSLYKYFVFDEVLCYDQTQLECLSLSEKCLIFISTKYQTGRE